VVLLEVVAGFLMTITDLVQVDIQERHNVGMERYGKPLTPDDGRDMLREAYEEALDMVFYLRCLIKERDDRENPQVP
jgi:hypothetical protein